MTKLLPVKTKIEAEKLIKISPFKSEIRTTTPHKHNSYFELIYLSEGSGYHYIDLHRYEVSPPVLYCIRKEQVHYWELTEEGKGFVVIIKKSFLDNNADPSIRWLFNRFSSECCYQLSSTTFLNTLFQLLLLASKEHTTNYDLMVEGLVKALLAAMASEAQPLQGQSALRSGIYASFMELLSTSGSIKHKVKFYADLLHTTPQNLNAACRKASGQTATDILSQFITSEAKRLLLYTNNTISETSVQLGFRDTSHFVKFFKKLTGVTPLHFRSGY